MKSASLALIATLIGVTTAEAQEFGVFGVRRQVWDRGESYFNGAGFSIGAFTGSSASSARMGVRAAFDVVAADVIESGFDDAPCAIDAPCGGGGPPTTTPPTRKMLTTRSLSAFLLPYVDEHLRLEFGLGGIWEDGVDSDGSAMLGTAGASWHLGNGPFWFHLGYQLRANTRQTSAAGFGNTAPRMSRHGLRAGLYFEAR